MQLNDTCSFIEVDWTYFGWNNHSEYDTHLCIYLCENTWKIKNLHDFLSSVCNKCISEIKIKLTLSKLCEQLIAHNLLFFLLHCIIKDVCLGPGSWGEVKSSFIPACWKAEFTACPPCDITLMPPACCYSEKT